MLICLWMGKTYTAKTPSSDFKVTIPENPLLSQQAVTSKGIPVPYTNLQLNPYPNTQLDLFYKDNLSFQCTSPSTWLINSMRGSQYAAYTPTWEGCGYKVLQFINTMKIMKLLGYKTLWRTNIAASLRERWTRAYAFDHYMLMKNFCIKLHLLWRPLK